jgi:co-chaperonin GroES (HSP10)
MLRFYGDVVVFEDFRVDEEKTESGLIIPGGEKKQYMRLPIVTFGDSCSKQLKPGQEVLLDVRGGSKKEIEHEGKKYLVYSTGNIVASF